MKKEVEEQREELAEYTKKFEELSDYSAAPLSDLEIKKLRKILEADARMDWLWATAWVWSRSILITVGSIYFVREWLGDALTWIAHLIK